MSSQTTRQPVAFIPHGGGPFSYVDIGFPQNEVDQLVDYWRSVGQLGPEKPKAVLVVSAHWESKVPTVSTAQQPSMLYDYYGFPQASYEIQWPSPGSPQLAQRVRDLLEDVGFETAEDPSRGYDHGTFIPMKRIFPDADIPTVQLSIQSNLDPTEHLAIGQALQPLRDEGVLILGSGMSYHNLRGFFNAEQVQDSEDFDAWLQDAVTKPAGQRDELLQNWEQAPAARKVHPREEHLLPLMVVAGAAGEELGTIPYSETLLGKRVSAVHFGTPSPNA